MILNSWKLILTVGIDFERLESIALGLGCSVEQIPLQLENWFDELGIPELVLSYITPEVINRLDDQLITRSRAANNIRAVDGSKAREIIRLALDRLNKSASYKVIRIST